MFNLKSIPRVFFWLTAGITICVIGLYFRLYPLTHNVSSDAYEQGTMLVISKMRQAVAAQVLRQYPDLPAAKKEQLVKDEFDKLVREHNKELRKAFDEAGQQILKHNGEQKHYLLEADAYYFLSLVQEILQKGSYGTERKGSKYFNPLMLAPLGYWQPITWHPYVGVIVYKIVHFFRPETDLMFGLGFTAVFLFPLVVAAFFFACRSLGCGVFPSFIAAGFFVLAPIYLQRSTFANFKNDAYNLLFPLLVFGLLFSAINHLSNIKRSSLYALLISICLALHATFWEGWGFFWGLSITGLVAAAVIAFFRDRSLLKPTFLLTAGLIIAPFIAVGILFGFAEVGQILLFAFGELRKFISPSMKGWPDLFIVVGELKHCSLSDVIGLTGGPIMFVGGVLALLWAVIRALITYDATTAKTATLAIYFAITLVLSLSAQRFTLLCLTPLALLFAFGVQELVSLKILRTKKALSAGIITLIVITLIFPLAHSQKEIRAMLSPIFNSAWERSLTKLRDHTPANSVIDTWWSPGHFVKAIAQRKVTFDGASIKGEQGYWLTRIYLSQTEDEALGLLRMLNVSSNNATEFLQNKGIPLSTAVPLITKATRLDRSDALEVYSRILPRNEASELLKMTHGTPPPSYVLIYNEIVEGNVLLGYLGKWNFKKVEDLNKNPEALQKIPSRSSPSYIDFIWSLVGGQYRQSPTLNPAGHSGNTILFDNGVEVNTQDMSVYVKSHQFGTGVPQSIFYADGNSVIEKNLPGGNLSYSAVLFKEADGAPRCVLMDRIIANSLIARMYYFNGLGLKHFRPFSRETDLTGRTKIFIFEVLWN